MLYFSAVLACDFKCEGKDRCITKEMVCNGEVDCQREWGSDEKDCGKTNVDKTFFYFSLM